jgi:hypothetical protein
MSDAPKARQEQAMATRVQLWGFENRRSVVQAVFTLQPDGTVGVEAPKEEARRYALGLVADGIEGQGGKRYRLEDGQAFLDNLKYHFRSRYTWVRDER